MISTVDDEHHTMTGGVGSYLYMAPEVVRYEEYNEKAGAPLQFSRLWVLEVVSGAWHV